MKNYKRGLFVFVGLLVGMAIAATEGYCDLVITIQPSDSGAETYYSVDWDNLSGAGDWGTSAWELHNPVTGGSAGTMPPSRFYQWTALAGSYVDSGYNSAFFAPGSPTYTHVSGDAGYGLWVDHDRGSDDIGVVHVGSSGFATEGSFVMRTDTYIGGFAAVFNTGTFTGGGATINVTSDAFVSAAAPAAVPEPSTALGLIGLFGGMFFRRRRRLMA